ncbi:MAG: MOSC domain-containing protein [Fimbriimonadaceae bacterium]|nr:MOSC domain-containing protein [Fimbriimonadaceae bacterium]
MGRLIAVSVSSVREVSHEGRAVATGIFKTPATGDRWIRTLGVEGDAQADQVHHGGSNKAVYAYPWEHYRFWADRLDRGDLLPGSFGENLTTEGLLEQDVCIGDRVRIGEAELQATQARVPCFKLEIRHDRPGLVKEFLEAERPGIYFRVVREGRVRVGDPVEIVARDPLEVSVARANRVMHFERHDESEIRRLAEHPAMSEEWRRVFRRLLGEEGV